MKYDIRVWLACLTFGLLSFSSLGANCPDGKTEHTSSLSSLTIGALTVNFESPKMCGTSPYEFTTNGTFSLSLPAPFDTDEAIELTGVDAEWTETDEGVISNKKISWSGGQDVVTIAGIKFSVTEIEFEDSPNFDATITLEAKVDVETAVKDIIYIQPSAGLGDVVITFNEDNTRSFDYSGLSNISLELRAEDDTTLASVSIAQVTADGTVADLSFTIEEGSGISYDSAGFDAAIEAMSMSFDFNIPDGDITYKSGSGELVLSSIDGISDDIDISLSMSESDITATLKAGTDIEAFGFSIVGSITFQYGYDFEMLSISASGLSISRDDEIDITLANVAFTIADGELDSFTATSASAGYGGFVFGLSEVGYESGCLALSASLGLPNGSMTVNGFKISEGGGVSITSISIAFTQAPLTLNGSVEFEYDGDSSKFEGRLNAALASSQIKADVVVGKTSTYNYVYGSLLLGGDFATIPSTPLKVSALGGKGGYNYTVNKEGVGSPSLGNHLVGFTIGIRDIGDNFELIGGTTIQFGSNGAAFEITGAVKAPAASPHYFAGSADINYSLGSGTVHGGINTSVKVPPSSGDVVLINSNDIYFKFSNSGWEVYTSSLIEGEILGQIDFDAAFTVKGTYASGLTSAGIGGNLHYSVAGSSRYPSDFNEVTGERSNIFDFGYYGEIEADLLGSFGTAFDDSGIDGTIAADFTASARLIVHWPDLSIWNDDHGVNEYTVAVDADAEITKSGSDLFVQGDATFTCQGESKSGKVKIKI